MNTGNAEKSFTQVSRHQSEVKYVTALIPLRMRPDGPATLTLRRRTMAMFLCLWLTALILQLADVSQMWKAFALGLYLPGGGLLYAGYPLLSVLSLVSFFLSLFIMWCLGPVLLPPFVWIGSAVLAAAITGDNLLLWSQFAVPSALISFIAISWYLRRRIFASEQKQGAKLNKQLEGITFPISVAPVVPRVVESSEEDIEALRYCLDLALQPINEWKGYSIIDQFREGALRYQLNFVQYACAMFQYTRTPAFTGYLAEAQRNTITKMLDPVIWKYWRWENLWGNLSWNPDPIVRDNVMLSGYFGVQLGLYESLNQDQQFSVPNALNFCYGKESYPYDFSKISGVLHHNLMKTPMCLFPCEPSWIYPFCSSYGVNTMLLHDRLHGTKYCDDVIPRARKAYSEEFMTAAGNTIFIKSGRWGVNMPTVLQSVSNAMIVYWCNSFMPEVSRRLWWTMRQTSLQPLKSGELNVEFSLPDNIDAGNYRFNNGLFGRTLLQHTAREMGDEELYFKLQEDIEYLTDCELSEGRRWYPGMSVYGNLQHILARFGRENAMREMIAFDLPKEWREGPVLSEVAYPDVLVAKAVSDGRALDLVLRPGEGPTSTTLGLSRLEPGRRYRVFGGVAEELLADNGGCAQIKLNISARCEVRVEPAD